jgi:hypothetical protein
VRTGGRAAATTRPSADVSRTSSPRVTSPIRTCAAAIDRSARDQRRIVGTAKMTAASATTPPTTAIHIPSESAFAFATGLSMTVMFSIIATREEQGPPGNAVNAKNPSKYGFSPRDPDTCLAQTDTCPRKGPPGAPGKKRA